MTDRHAGYLVTLEADIREDDAEGILNAMRHIKGVVDVAPVKADALGQIGETRVRYDLLAKIGMLLRP